MTDFQRDPEMVLAVEKLATVIMEAMYKERPDIQVATLALVKIMVGTILQVTDKVSRHEIMRLAFKEITTWVENEEKLEIVDLTDRFNSGSIH